MRKSSATTEPSESASTLAKPVHRYLTDVWEPAIADWAQWLTTGGMSPPAVMLRRHHLRAVAQRSGYAHPNDVTLAELVNLCNAHSLV